jgi:hypothetical protein
MDFIPTNEQIREVLSHLWIDAVCDEKYDYIFDYTGSNSQFNNGYDEIYEERLNSIKIELGMQDE